MLQRRGLFDVQEPFDMVTTVGLKFTPADFEKCTTSQAFGVPESKK
jgi:hypothetical protein